MRLANPRWVQDEAFELGLHVRRIAAPAPGRLRDVLDYACQTGMSGFDRARALWEFTLIEGLADGRAALVMKVHHALTDGVGGMELATHLFDLEPESEALGPPPLDDPGSQMSSTELVRDALSHEISGAVSLAREQLHAAPYDAVRILRHPWTALRRGADMARSVARMVQPANRTLSPLMRSRRLSWHYDALSVPIPALRGAALASGLTLNDAFLGAVSGGLRRYHERYDTSVDELRITMPISIRKPDDPAGGNRITLMRFKVPIGLQDPLARMQRIHELCLRARREPAISHTNAIARVLNFLPRSMIGSMLKHVDFLASNVPGFDAPVYLAGERVVQWYAFGPTTGAALNITLLSYDGTCYIGVNADTGAIHDCSAMIECLRAGFDEVTASMPTGPKSAGPQRRLRV